MKLGLFFTISILGVSTLQNGCGNANSANQSVANNLNSIVVSASPTQPPSTATPPPNPNATDNGISAEEAKELSELHERCRHTPVDKIKAVPTVGVAPLTVLFDGSESYDPDKTKIVRWQWGISDGTDELIDGKKIRHTFKNPGTYFVLLTVTNQSGEKNSDCGHKESIKITVSTMPDSSKIQDADNNSQTTNQLQEKK